MKLYPEGDWVMGPNLKGESFIVHQKQKILPKIANILERREQFTKETLIKFEEIGNIPLKLPKS